MAQNRRLGGCFNVGDLRRRARRRLPRAVFDFCDGAAGDERTLRRNEAAFAEMELVPRALARSGEPDLSLELLGRPLSMPLLIGPTGLSGMLWPRGEIAASRAAAAAGTVYVQSHGSTCSMEELGASGPGARWFQVFIYRDRGLTKSFVERAQAAGFEGLVLTVDNHVLGIRERDLRNGFTVPPRVTPANALDMVRRIPWLMSFMGAPRITFANYREAGHGDNILSLAAYVSQVMEPTIGWEEVAWVRSLWQGPFILKGILHPDDARRAVEHGVDAVIVSNHGGRQLDGAVSSARALPEVAQAVDGHIPVLLDGGVRRGMDVVRALALGASACLIGRPHLWGLAVAGEAGVARVLDLYRQEIVRTMALGGWSRLADLSRDAIRLPGEPIVQPPAGRPVIRMAS
jgi:L-lactate dehydrogenase (cytochrome)/(S)-mandelate dehydrogenase